MAKLSARGRTQVVRLQRYQNEQPTDTGEIQPLIRTELVLCSDNVVLRKTTWIRPNGQSHNTGWKAIGKLKADKTPDEFRRIYTEKEPRYEEVS